MAKQRRPEFAPESDIELEIWTPPSVGYVDVRFLGRIRFVCEHWLGKRGRLCIDRDSCKFHRQGEQGKCLGFVAAERYRDSQYQDWCPCVCQISPVLYLHIGRPEVRGQVWRIRKVTGRSGKAEFH